MPKKFIKRYMPDHDTIRHHPHLNKLFGTLLHDPNLLHLNRRSVSGAFFIGLFMAFVPIPFQMVPAAALAIYLRTNLPLSVGLVWVSNPITIPPIFWFCYEVGALLTGTPLHSNKADFSLQWVSNELSMIWEPFLLGCLVVAVTCSLVGGFGIRLLWRLNVVRQWQARKKLRDMKREQD